MVWTPVQTMVFLDAAPAGCAVGRSILVIVWHLLNDPATRHGAAMPGTVITWEG